MKFVERGAGSLVGRGGGAGGLLQELAESGSEIHASLLFYSTYQPSWNTLSVYHCVPHRVCINVTHIVN
ncbi:hypothetical protein E2C01_087151 [Portunus trituberculatus]|uniref:Uncharacterized protein n=1 Tax=Portunus trituberculatus TaxID=210409 RepID=A0A5B7JB67_PORTR|nr:hypothetical protein [Portunus trituberculatus]